MSAVHGKQTVTDGIHISYAWVFADAASRTATTDPLTNAPYSASDIGKFARQVDDNSIWMLTGTTPTWVGVSNNAAVSGLTAGRVVFVNTDGSLTDDSVLVWDNTNKRLGIGTVSPAKVLDIEGDTQVQNSSSHAQLLIISSALNAYLELDAAGGGGRSYKVYSDITDNFIIRDDTTGVSRILVNGAGHVLVNTTTATTGSQLDVAGDIVVSDGAGSADVTISDGLLQYNYLKTISGSMSTIVTSGTGSITLNRTVDNYKNYIVRVSILASNVANSTNSVLFEETAAFSMRQTAVTFDRGTTNLINFTGTGISIARSLGTGSVTYTITNGSALALNNTAYSVEVLSGDIDELTVSST